MNSMSFSLTLDLLCIRIESILPLNSLWLHYLRRDFTFFTIWIHDTFCALALNPVSFSRIHYEITLFRKFSKNSLPVSIATSSWIFYLFREFTIYSLSYLRISYGFTLNTSSFSASRIHLTLKKIGMKIGMNQLSQLSNALEFTVLFVNVIEFNIFVANSLKIHFLLSKFTFYFAYSIWIGFFARKL